MNILNIEKYNNKNSLIHKVNPLVKLILTLFYIFTLLSVNKLNLNIYLYFFMYIFILMLLSKISIFDYLKRVIMILPFFVFVFFFVTVYTKGESFIQFHFIFKFNISYAGLFKFANLLIRSCLSLFALLVLSFTTKFNFLINSLEKLHTPKIFITIINTMYRYIFVIKDESKKLIIAKNVKEFNINRFFKFKILSNIIGILFIKTYDKSERIYNAMLVRGYGNQTVNSLSNTSSKYFLKNDYFILIIFIVLIITGRIIWI